MARPRPDPSNGEAEARRIGRVSGANSRLFPHHTASIVRRDADGRGRAAAFRFLEPHWRRPPWAAGGGRLCLRLRRRGRLRCTARRSVDVVRLQTAAPRRPFISHTQFCRRSHFGRARSHAGSAQGAVMSTARRHDPNPNARAVDAAETPRMLAERIESLCRTLLPAGCKESGSWRVGDIGNNKGSSLSVALTGAKHGLLVRPCDRPRG